MSVFEKIVKHYIVKPLVSFLRITYSISEGPNSKSWLDPICRDMSFPDANGARLKGLQSKLV